ncbi:coiled-coil domain-containing protein 92-like [Mercenaria mercenaria]|uniref:coiled-coil domain-containing protein 92-like n=1 Tax=Mercenaria mercenaria TaxID=6596 RepID=UPI001E1D7706|nr:coiled-coil domain-containing protein 92-like [Mercenaria mercenaria]
MATQEAIHKRNLESSILFMQQEHAATLKALHEEIKTLQKKCSDLTFELNMAGLDIGDGVPTEVVEHIKHLEKMIDAQRETQHELEVELEKKDKLIKENEYTYKRQKMKHIEELRARNKEMDELRAQLDAASNSNAYYQNELLKIKKEKFIANQAGPHPHEGVRAPAPPKESRSNPKRAFHIRRTLAEKEDLTELNHISTGSAGAVRGSSGGTSRSDSPAELAKPFLRTEDAEIQIKTSNPLPPIRTSSGRVLFREPVDVVHVSVHNVPKPPTKSKKPGTVTQEVETLAVGQVSHADPAWKHHRRKESHSSEYR